MKAWFSVILAGALVAAGCRDKGATSDEAPLEEEGEGDCDPADPLVGPGATELCDGIDNNCDGSVDEGVTTAWFPDADGDGYGDGAAPVQACGAPDGHQPNGDDCDDADAAVNPMAAEVCDGLDNDCTGAADEGLASTFYLDYDADGYGGEAVDACEAPEGAVAEGGDCDDGNAAFYPGAAEDCTDPEDYNCDGSSGYADDDGDGWAACEEGGAGDCDDNNPLVNPGAAEICDGIDNDCASGADDGLSGTFYLDEDGDGYGSDPVDACEAPEGAVAVDGDCDDADAAVSPEAKEDCATEADDDCDGNANGTNALSCQLLYRDDDGDGYGDPADGDKCYCAPKGYYTSSNMDDCDDDDIAVHPAAAEVCDDALDNDCDGTADDDCDPEEPVGWDGSYSGLFTVEVETDWLGITDTCSGTVTLKVEEGASPRIAGVAVCEFSGSMALWTSTLTFTIEGDITVDPAAGGTISVLEESDTWEGAFAGDVLAGVFEGSGTVGGVNLSYDGDFSAVR